MGPAAVEGTYHHAKKRGRTTVVKKWGKCTLHFIPSKKNKKPTKKPKNNTFASSYPPNIMLLCGQCWLFSFKRSQNTDSAFNMQIKQLSFCFFPGLSTPSQRYVGFVFNLCHWCRENDHANDWLIGQNTLNS